MKKVVICTCTGLAILLISVGAVKQRNKALFVENRETHTATDSTSAINVENAAVIKFDETRNDFGTVRKRDTPITVIFRLQNVGDIPLIILLRIVGQII